MKKYTKKVRKTDKKKLMERAGAWGCALALSMTLSMAAFAEEPLGEVLGEVVLQQTPMTEVTESRQPTAEALETEQGTAETAEPEQVVPETEEPEQEAAETAEPEQPEAGTGEPDQETPETAQPLQLTEELPEEGTPETAVQTPESSEQELALDVENFPDPAFLASLGRFDLDGNGSLSLSEREAVTEIDVRSKGIQSLEGIGAFPNLTRLNCIGNTLTQLPLDQMPKLTSLLCNENQLTQLDLSQLPMLRVLHCHDNQLTELDVSQNPELYELACGDNPFTSLDVTHNPQLAYLLYLGGPLEILTLGGNHALKELWCSYALVSELDLAQAPNLEMLGIEYSQIRFLDLEANPRLTHVLASGCRLLGAKLPEGISADLSHQRAVEVHVGAHETTFDLMRLGLPLDMANISNVTGAQLQGSVLTGISDAVMVTYDYDAGGARLTASVLFHGSNGWVEPLSLEDWTYGEPPHQPHAEAEYGNVVYTYSDSPDGTFGPEVPTQAGTWYVKASVAESPDHAGLTDVEEFHILKAHPTFTVPTGLTAVYGNTLASVDPGSGFVWEDPGQKVGSVGEKTFLASYLPEDTDNYQVENHLPVVVRVLPKQAREEWVPRLTGSQDLASLQVRDGQTTLRQGRDYTVTTYTENGWVTVMVVFQGNYTGQIRRGYPQESSGTLLPPPAANETKVPPPQQEPIVDAVVEDTRPQATSSPSATPGPDGESQKEEPAEPTGQEGLPHEDTADAPSAERKARDGMILIWLLLILLVIAIWLFEGYKKGEDEEKPDSDLND